MSFTALACGELSSRSFNLFAVLKEKPSILVKLESNESKNINTYEINLPIKDSKKKDYFLNNISVKVLGQFDFNIDYYETQKNEDAFYTAYFQINKSLEDKITIDVDYNGRNKDGTSIYLCGNSKEYKLSKLLEAKP